MTEEQIKNKIEKDKEEKEESNRKEINKIILNSSINLKLYSDTIKNMITFIENKIKQIQKSIDEKNFNKEYSINSSENFIEMKKVIEYCKSVKSSIKEYHTPFVMVENRMLILNIKFLNMDILIDSFWKHYKNYLSSGETFVLRNYFKKLNSDFTLNILSSTVGEIKSIDNTGFSIVRRPDLADFFVKRRLSKKLISK